MYNKIDAKPVELFGHNDQRTDFLIILVPKWPKEVVIFFTHLKST